MFQQPLGGSRVIHLAPRWPGPESRTRLNLGDSRSLALRGSKATRGRKRGAQDPRRGARGTCAARGPACVLEPLPPLRDKEVTWQRSSSRSRSPALLECDPDAHTLAAYQSALGATRVLSLGSGGYLRSTVLAGWSRGENIAFIRKNILC